MRVAEYVPNCISIVPPLPPVLSGLSEYKEDNAVVTKNAFVVVKRVPALKTGGLLAKMKALDAAAALQSTATATYGVCFVA